MPLTPASVQVEDDTSYCSAQCEAVLCVKCLPCFEKGFGCRRRPSVCRSECVHHRVHRPFRPEPGQRRVPTTGPCPKTYPHRRRQSTSSSRPTHDDHSIRRRAAIRHSWMIRRCCVWIRHRQARPVGAWSVSETLRQLLAQEPVAERTHTDWR